MKGRLASIASLTGSQHRAMCELMESHYLYFDTASFRADLVSKSHILLLEVDEQIVGFTSLVVYDTRGTAGEHLQVVYSGDTVVDRAHWGSPTLFKSWLTALMELGAFGSARSSYWLLLASGARTYRMLPAFCRCYAPHANCDHTKLAGLADHLAAERFGGCYDATSGIVRFPHAYAVRPEIMPTWQSAMNPHVQYFHAKNPGHMAGDELVCLAELAPQNLTRLGTRMMKES